MTTSSNFMVFWSAINAQLGRGGMPEITYGPARRLWDAAISAALREVWAATTNAQHRDGGRNRLLTSA